MTTRNVLNSLGDVIGTLTLPDSTTEDQWTAALAPYAAAASSPPVLPYLKTIVKTATDSVTTSSSTPATVSGMTDQPEAGTYMVDFNASISTGGASASGKFGIYVDDVVVSETLRPISCNLVLLGGLVTISLNNIGLGTKTGSEIVLNGSQTIDIKYFSTNGGTIGFAERVFTLIKVR